MRYNLLRHSIPWAFASIFLYTSATSTIAGSFTRGCAARDLQILMLIEERENTNAVSQEKLSEAMLTMLHARNICYAGRVMEALSLYDGISQSLTAGTVLSGRIP